MSSTPNCPRVKSQGRDLGDEYLFFDREADQVHLLNETAREVLLLCDGTRDAAALGTKLAQIYEIDREQAVRDSQELILVLHDLGLIEYPCDRPEE